MTADVRQSVLDADDWDALNLDEHWPEFSEAAYYAAANAQYKTFRTAREARQAVAVEASAIRDMPGVFAASGVERDLDRIVEPLAVSEIKHLGNAIACALMGLTVHTLKTRLNDIHTRRVNDARVIGMNEEAVEARLRDAAQEVRDTVDYHQTLHENLKAALNRTSIPVPLTDTAPLAGVIDPELYAVITETAAFYSQINA